MIGYFVKEQVGPDGIVETVGECTEAFGRPTEFWLWAFFTVFPAVTSLLAIIPFHFYTLRGDKMQEIRAEMKERRLQLAAEETTNGGASREGG